MPRPPATPPLPYLLFRTTPRDRYLAKMLHEHRALTAEHINRLAFTNLSTCYRRLRVLTQLAVLDATRIRTTSRAAAPSLYTLGPAGALLVAAARDVSVKELRYDRAMLQRQAARPDLGHDLACNTLMIHLAVRHRHTPGLTLPVWWGPISCLRLWGDQIRPDAYALARDGGRAVSWFFEYDSGTESVTQLVGKLRAYHRFATGFNGACHPVLIHLPTEAREQRVHEAIADTYPDRCPVPVAPSTGSDLAGSGWRIADRHPDTGTRWALVELPAAFTGHRYLLAPPQTTGHEIHAPNPAWHEQEGAAACPPGSP